MPKDKKRTVAETAHLLGISRGHLQRLMKDDDDLSELVKGEAPVEDIMLHLDAKKHGHEFHKTTDAETLKRRRFAEMKQAEQKALMLEMERREMERDLIPATDVRKSVSRVMQTIKNSFNNVPPKVRQAYQAASTPIEVEQLMHDVIREALEAATNQLEELD